jgi:glucose/mannose-6-phosphate isomerase
MDNYEIDFSKQFQVGALKTKDIKLDGRFDRIIFCGIGGSAIPGEILSMLWISNFNCYINREFGLPHWVDERCLVICTSWSGNTEETVSSFEEARKRNLKIVVISKGGKLEQVAKEHDIPCIVLPDDTVPARFGIGYMLASILTLLSNSAIIDNNLLEAAKNGASGPDFSSRIGNKIPLIYSSYSWRYLARFWKVHFNENSKVHSFSNYLPEAAHNEISGFTQTNRDSYFPILLIDKNEHPADIKKLEKFATFLTNQNIDFQKVEILGSTRLEKILNNYNFAISVSVALAKLKNVEPFDTSTIEQFKKT